MPKRKTLTDTLRLRGDLAVEIVHAVSGRTRRYVIRNTITYDGLNSPLYLWSQDGIVPTDYQFQRLRPGTSTTPPLRGDLNVLAPVVGADIILGPANRIVSPATAEIVVTGTLGVGDANGNTLTEVGLILGNGTLFARQIHPAFQKTIAFTLTYTWRIAVTA